MNIRLKNEGTLTSIRKSGIEYEEQSDCILLKNCRSHQNMGDGRCLICDLNDKHVYVPIHTLIGDDHDTKNVSN